MFLELLQWENLVTSSWTKTTAEAQVAILSFRVQLYSFISSKAKSKKD